MAYSLVFSDAAKADIFAIVEYIATALDNPPAASRLVDRVEDTLSAIVENPEMFPLSEVNVFAKLKCHYFSVGNYLVYYRVNRAETTIDVVTMVYAGRNLAKW